MRVVVIDGQGGSLGKALVEGIRKNIQNAEIIAIGTNSTAATNMLKAGADRAAAGENPVVVGVRDADIIVGPIGIIMPDALMGEITPKMALAVGESRAYKILIPLAKCGLKVAGTQKLSIDEYISLVVDDIKALHE